MAQNRSPATVAQLLLINAKLYQEEAEREVARYRFSAETLRRLSGRKLIRRAFLEELTTAFADLGWYLLELETDYAILNSEKVRAWVKLGPKRLFEQGVARLNDKDIESKYEELFPASGDAAEGDD